MPTPEEVPNGLRPYRFHGLELRSVGSDQALGLCPFCDKDKFYAHTETGLWDCKSCGLKGNAVEFLRKLWEESDKATPPERYDPLARERKLLHWETLMHWGVCRSTLTDEWLVPAHGSNNAIVQLYRYVQDPQGRRRLMATPTLSHGLHGVHLMARGCKRVYLCEGPWDGMALWEALRGTKVTEEGAYKPTGSEASSLLGNASVLAVPGCATWQDSWRPLFAGREVVLLYDNDHPRAHPKTGTEVGLQGYTAMKRIAGLLAEDAEHLPAEIHYLDWSRYKAPAG